MKANRPIPEQAKELLSYNSETGKITWAKKRQGVKHGTEAGTTNMRGYRQINLCGKSYLAHRIAWFLHYGINAGATIDHIDRNKQNNRMSNLRCVGQDVNMHNVVRKTTSKSGYSNIQRNHNKFIARVRLNGRNAFIGSFSDIEEAHAAVIAFKIKHHMLPLAHADLRWLAVDSRAV